MVILVFLLPFYLTQLLTHSLHVHLKQHFAILFHESCFGYSTGLWCICVFFLSIHTRWQKKLMNQFDLSSLSYYFFSLLEYNLFPFPSIDVSVRLFRRKDSKLQSKQNRVTRTVQLNRCYCTVHAVDATCCCFCCCCCLLLLMFSWG